MKITVKYLLIIIIIVSIIFLAYNKRTNITEGVKVQSQSQIKTITLNNTNCKGNCNECKDNIPEGFNFESSSCSSNNSCKCKYKSIYRAMS